MDGTIMISLIGEQPIPNLLAVLYAQPQHAVLVCTERTKAVSERLCSVLKERGISVKDKPVDVDPYNMAKIESKLKSVVREENWPPDKIIFNLTGGTKPMALAAYRLAEQLSCPFLYVQSEGKKSVVYHYRFLKRGPELEKADEVPPVLDIDLYLKAHLEGYTETDEFKNEFERMVHAVLRSELDEVKNSVKPVPELGGLEIDLVLRCGNRVGIAEVKTGKKARSKEGIEQIITAAEQRFLGTYTEKFLILDREYEPNNRQLADAHRITVIELPSAQSGKLSEEDRRKLVNTVKRVLGG
ncbi:MAG: DUF1887 family protein [Firmicutes bacterium]|nr:DUF1887 family protein [Bacillota bacterium]